MFYHARIVLKPERAKDSTKIAIELDLSYLDLLQKIAEPFVRKEAFFCGGVPIQPNRVEEFIFAKTDQSSDDLMPILLARARMNNVLIFSDDKSPVVWAGVDITRLTLDQAKLNVESAEPATRKQGSGTGEPPAMQSKSQKSTKVFIVHGHDRTAVDQAELLIRRFGLDPIILRNVPNAGKTVIEKFEKHSDVGAAVILLTPDDVGGVKGGELNARARQNVIWEWGYLVAHLGRPSVICLYKQGVELPSDLHGLVWTEIKNDLLESSEEIRRELIEAGYEIK